MELKENNTPSSQGNKVKGDAYTRLLREWSRPHIENGLLYSSASQIVGRCDARGRRV